MKKFKTEILPQIMVSLLLFIGLFFLWQGIDNYRDHMDSPMVLKSIPPLPGFTIGRVDRVIDGDTIVAFINGKDFTIRLVGVNTPETVDPKRAPQCFGKQASEETKKLLTNQNIYLSKSISETDKYGRLLRFVYLPQPDGNLLFVNDYLVRSGFASVETVTPDVQFADRFTQAELEAKQKNLGMWAVCKSI